MVCRQLSCWSMEISLLMTFAALSKKCVKELCAVSSFASGCKGMFNLYRVLRVDVLKRLSANCTGLQRVFEAAGHPMGVSEGYHKQDRKGYSREDRGSSRSVDPPRRDRDRGDGSDR